MEQKEKKVTFATKIGIVFATAGSAVGLGNIWHFPTTCGENGGAAFLLLYLVITLCLGIPGMLSEFIIGRNGGRNAMFSYAKAGGKKVWGIIGIMGMLCSSLILGFYSVIAGWCIYYLFLALSGNALGSPEVVSNTFNELIARDNYIPVILSVVFIFLTHIIIVRGVRKGIEAASKIMVPSLFILLVVLIIASCTLDNAMDGIRFLFQPDFSAVDSHVVFMAIGEAFFSLSMGTACLCTYASYFDEKVNVTRSTLEIVSIDVIVAIMAGLMIFPAAFSVGVEPAAGPSLVFMTMPNVFEGAFGPSVAYFVSILFYLLLTIAALTSTISMHEIGTALVSQETKLSRKGAAWCVTGFCSVIGMLSALSMSHSELSLFNTSLFDCFDMLTANIMLPTGALFTFIIIGWIMPRTTIVSEVTNDGTLSISQSLISLYLILSRYVCPVLIVVIFLYKLGVIG